MDLTKIILNGYLVNQEYSLLNIPTLKEAGSVSIDDLKKVIESKTKYTITVYVVKWEGDGCVKGKLNRYKHNADIFISDRKMITECEQRFITAKEMSHLVIDSPHTYTDDIEKLVKALVYPDKIVFANYSEQYQSEILAEVLAAELLFPWKYRDEVIEQIKSGEKTSMEIAKQFMFPLKKMEWIIELNNHRAISEVHKQLNILGAFNKTK
jgi:Zn-dependent peptidase ImmA (M78 family)